MDTPHLEEPHEQLDAPPLEEPHEQMDAPPQEEQHELQEQDPQPIGPMPMEVILTKRGLPMRQSALCVAARVADIIAWEKASDNSKLVRDVAEVFEDEFKHEADNKRRRVKNTPYKALDSDSEVELGNTDDDEEEDTELDSGSEDHDFDDPTLESEEDDDIESDSEHGTIEVISEDSEDGFCVDSEDGFCVDSEDRFCVDPEDGSRPKYAGVGFCVDPDDGLRVDSGDEFPDIANDIEDTNTSAEVEHSVEHSVDMFFAE